MSGAPERKYTDSDVRADPTLLEMAYEYLDEYTGDFEPLVRAQCVLSEGRHLTTSQARVVLNCMRHDWNIADKLPAPQATIIPMPAREEVKMPKKKKRYTLAPDTCGNPEVHPPHNWSNSDFDYELHCRGVSNDRKIVQRDARIKVPYVKARSGAKVHLLTGDGYYEYWPNQYGSGYDISYLMRRYPAEFQLWGLGPTLWVKTMCKYPSWIKSPLLFAEFPENMISAKGDPVELCNYCHTARKEEILENANS